MRGSGEVALEMTKTTGGNPWTSRGFWCSELVTTLQKVGFPRATYAPYTAKGLPKKNLVIVFFEGGAFKEHGHFVVRWKGQWMCPYDGELIDDADVTNVKWIIYPEGLTAKDGG